MALYKRKNDDRAAVDGWIDKALLYVGLIAPLVTLAILHPDARSTLTLPQEPTSWELMLVTLATWSIIACTAVFLGRQVMLWWMGQPINALKVMFLFAVVSFHVFVVYHPAMMTTGLNTFAACVTIYHDLQYHAIVWHAQRAKLDRPGVDRTKHGLSALACCHPVVYLGCAVLMGIGAWGLGCLLDIRPGCMPILQSGEFQVFGPFTLRDLLIVFVLGFIMHHYFVDQFIWRPSKDAEVRRDLRLTSPT